jgi:nickel superoxide dismutase
MKSVDAHCDLPCGIYETDTLSHAAATVKRMIEKIEALGELDSIEKYNTFVRAVNIKEQHAQKVKDQLYILWSDYFKPEHLEKFPHLHDTIWKTVKQASKARQTVSMEEADTLIEMVHQVNHIFADSKN